MSALIRMHKTTILRTVRAVLVATAVVLLVAQPALGHDQPPGAEWLMADWMLFSFMAFGFIALIAFLFALKRGYLSNLEEAKYYILTIDEPDYYTPGWARPEMLEEQNADR